MKQKKQFLILIGLIVVFAVAYFSMQAWNGQQDTGEDDTVSMDLWTGTPLEIISITYTYEDEVVQLSYASDTGVWENAQDADFPLDDTYPEAMVDGVAALTASRELSGDDVKLSEYGLEDPAMTITLGVNSGDVILKVGNLNSVLDMHYFTISNSDSVYMIDSSFVEYFQYGMYDMITEEELPYITLSVVENAVVTYGGNTWNYVLKEEMERDEEGNETNHSVWYQYQNDEEQGIAIEEETLNTYLKGCLYVYAQGWINYNASQEDLQSYGLVEPVAQITVGYTSEETTTDDEGNETTVTSHLSYTLQFGNVAMTDENDVSYIYATTTATNRVFLMEQSVLDTLLGGLTVEKE